MKNCIESMPHPRMFTMELAFHKPRATRSSMWFQKDHWGETNSYKIVTCSRSTELEVYLLWKILLLLNLRIRHHYPKALFSVVKVNFIISSTQTSTFLKSFLSLSSWNHCEHITTTVARIVTFLRKWEQYFWKWRLYFNLLSPMPSSHQDIVSFKNY